MSVQILIGDCRLRLRELPDASVDSCVTDPPYHLTSIVKRFGQPNSAPVKIKKFPGQSGSPYARSAKGFMGQTWDGGDVAFQPETWAEVARVMKPGSHLIAFSGTRTYHRMACAIEDAGFEIRDQLAWIYGSGFPKSHNLDGEWEGWGTALKPAWEPICFARLPVVGTIAANVLQHGTGAINIDACRVEGGAVKTFPDRTAGDRSREQYRTGTTSGPGEMVDRGRWPANIIHDGSDEVLAGFPETTSGVMKGGTRRAAQDGPGSFCYGTYGGDATSADTPGDSGSAARFFYSAKVTSAERGEGNNHPTVKPVDLMRWLCRLITPKGGTVLDPFAGSGSTLIAADAEQFHAIGCELSPGYAAIAEQRIRDSAGMFAEVRAA